MTQTIIIDGNRIHHIESFYQEINAVFMQSEDWELAPSLDAFNDLLYGEYGVLKNYNKTIIVWLAFNKNRADLGIECTKQYYLQKLAQPKIYNQKYFQEKLNELETGVGQTYFDILLEIIAEHKNIELTPR